MSFTVKVEHFGYDQKRLDTPVENRLLSNWDEVAQFALEHGRLACVDVVISASQPGHPTRHIVNGDDISGAAVDVAGYLKVYDNYRRGQGGLPKKHLLSAQPQ